MADHRALTKYDIRIFWQNISKKFQVNLTVPKLQLILNTHPTLLFFLSDKSLKMHFCLKRWCWLHLLYTPGIAFFFFTKLNSGHIHRYQRLQYINYKYYGTQKHYQILHTGNLH